MSRRLWGTPRQRKFVVVKGIAPPVFFSVYNDDFNALVKAVKERVFFVKDQNGDFVAPPRPADKAFFFSRMSDFTNALGKHLPSTVPIERQEFVDCYSGRKRVLYQNACDSLDILPLRVKDSYIKTFLKFEKTNFTSKVPVPRVISPRDPRFNIEIGRYIRPIEERIFKSIGKVMGKNTVMKGLNSAQVATAIRRKWDSFKNPVAVGMDASRFDQHVSREALQWEHSIYDACFWRKIDRERLAKLTSQQLSNHCYGRVGDGKVKFVTDGVRASGDMNTSLGACLIMCGMVYSYSKSVGVDIQLVNNGDDCVVIMEKGDYAKFSAGAPDWFREMGFTMVIEQPVFTFEKIVFCQAQPVYSGPGPSDYIMVRDPRVAIPKDSVCMHPFFTPKEFLGWVKAVGDGGIALAGGMPVWQSFYHMYQRSAVGVKAHDLHEVWGWGVRRMAYGCARTTGPISAKTRASFYWAFDVVPEAQECLERIYEGKTILGSNEPRVASYLTLPL